jgi:hypothetical protein
MIFYWCFICLYLLISPVDAQNYTNSQISYLSYVQNCLDRIVEYGTDRYGEIHSPIFVSILDVDSLKCPQNPLPLDEQWRVTRRKRRNPAGANLLTDQQLLKTMRWLTLTTGEQKYLNAANAYMAYYLRNFIDEKGFIWWGWHRHYDVFKDKMDGHSGNPHEIHAINSIDWPMLWQVDSTAVRKEIEAIWQWHVIDKSTGEINRHGDGRAGCDFSMSAGAYIEAFIFMYVETNQQEWLDRAKFIANYYWQRRNKDTNLFPERPNAGSERFDGSSFVTAITGPYCHALLKAYEATKVPIFRNQAETYLKAYAQFGFDQTSGRFWGALKLDGKPVPGPRISEGYGQYEPRGYLDLWEPYVAGYQYAVYTAQNYVYAFQLTKEEFAYTTASGFARWIEKTPPGTNENKSTWYQSYSDSQGKKGTYAGKYGRAISFFINMYVISGEDNYLEEACRLADTGIEKLYKNGLFRGHPAKPYYEAMDGVGYLLYALLQLDYVLNNKEAVIDEKMIQVNGLNLPLDNW